MTGVYFKGRLGNQMFQYVFYRYIKAENPDKLIFFSNPHHANLATYFELEQFQALTFESKLYSIFIRFIPKLLFFKDVFFFSFVAPRKVSIENFKVYNGYFQTDWYLNQLAEKPLFKIKPKFVSLFETQYGNIFKNEKTIAVHIRRTDYLKYGKRDISLPIEYFKDRLAEIENIDSYKVIFVSDDIPFVKASFTEKPNYIFSSNEEIIDFQIIQNADIAIISNSSFGWWAAYLNKKPGKIFAPKNWLGFRIGAEHPKGIMTKKFIWKDVIPMPHPSNKKLL
ncbi:MAG TPA: alpha-1,2-fucosyltransferase [Pedobacter sp.]|jgi:hypothetical protein